MAEFWSLTPHETYMVIEAADWRMERQHKRDMCLAWHVAALSRAKRLPALKRLLGTDKAKVLEGKELERKRAEHREIMQKIDVDRINVVKRKHHGG